MRKWLLGLALLGTPLMVCEAVAQDLPLERVFASPELAGPVPRLPKLSPDGSLLTLLRNRADEKDRFDLWAMDTATGQWRMLVDSKKVGSGAEISEAEKMQRERARITNARGIVNYSWSLDGKSIIVPLDGDVYLASVDGRVQRLTNSPEGELNPMISPKGNYFSFARGQNFFVQSLSGGEARQLTSDGAGTVHWGEAQFVEQEEIHRYDGYWWAPDEQHIAVERFDEARVGVVSRAAIGADGTRVYSQRYPAAGTPNAVVELYVMKPDGSARVKVDLGANDDIYVARVSWAPDGKTLYVQRQSRDQKALDMLKVDPATGASSVLFTETSKTWLNISDAYKFLNDGSLIWASERDGYRHLYHFSKGKWRQLTKGQWVVSTLAGVDEKTGKVYFVANKDTPLEMQVYSIDLKKPDAVTRLTESGYFHSAVMNKGATRFIVTRSNAGQPTQSYLADQAGNRLAWIEENALKEGHPYYPYLASHRTPQYGTLKARDGTTLYWEMITPKLEPGRKYPVFVEYYGGPGTSQRVAHKWENPLVQHIVDRGYIYFQIDGRGSNFRGKAFEDQIFQKLGTVEVEDQIAGIDYLKSQDFVDKDRIGGYGWSYGGFMTLKLLEKHPGVFAAAVSGAPVVKWGLYDTHYTERYLGDPNKDPQAYAAADTIADAGRIRDPLLLMHGMSDDNVVLDNSTALAAKLQAENRPFEMMFYPGKAHSAPKDIHVWTTVFNFFDREVKNKR
ncbi:MAG: S9 family peptidase [Sphingomonas sp.]|uniref:S9 family peptidase n=1 Tax=Sphingomonas sp. TaxID=28214 RepID=UPI0025CE7698|nr:DPP IV N-terminal domain-containing protein [Sphingomonas sp.]MBX3564970.1 S9 family peptidase [Sphingomonas sp.]